MYSATFLCILGAHMGGYYVEKCCIGDWYNVMGVTILYKRVRVCAMFYLCNRSTHCLCR